MSNLSRLSRAEGHRCQKCFLCLLLFLLKNTFLTFFLVLNIFYFLVAKIFNPNKPAKLYIKRLLSDGFSMAAVGNSLDEEP